MTPKETGAAVGALALLAVAAIVALDEKTPDVKAQEKRVGLTRLAVLDGGKAYIVEVEVDAGDGKTSVELRKAATPGCVRRPAGAPVNACLRDWGQGPKDFGDSNRFPESEAVGAGCEPVACSVTAGEDSLASEDDRLAEKKAAEGAKP